jgi:ParB-like chromosome segregation protein Spo0J
MARAGEIAEWQLPRVPRSETDPAAEQESVIKIDGSSVEFVPVSSLLPAFSPRIDGEDDEHIKMLADVGSDLPPILVHRPTMRVIDGMHRLGAAKLRGDNLIKVQFFERSEREAFVLSVKMNIAHGRPLSLADRARAAERIIEAYPQWSDRAIAMSAGLSARSVADIRARMGAAVGEGITARVGRDGKVRPLDHVGGRLRALEAFKERPDASLREIAKIAGVSPATALDVRNRMNRGEEPAPSPARPARRPASEQTDKQRHDERERGVPALLKGLTADPSLRFSETGRGLLRWMLSHSVAEGEWRPHVNEVPPHCAYIVASIARQVADQWLELAGEVEQLTASAEAVSGRTGV